jgi:hypothetical protein
MADRPSRKRQIIRRVALALLVVVWLPAFYVSSSGAFHWFAGYEARGRPDVTSTTWPQVTFKPLVAYLESEGPGDRAINIFSVWCYHRGSGENMRGLIWRIRMTNQCTDSGRELSRIRSTHYPSPPRIHARHG